MNVLFALYQNFACNSANHVDGIARELTALGCSCVVAVPSHPTQAELLGSVPYRIATFEQVLAGEVGFDNGQGIDAAHFWTPRSQSPVLRATSAVEGGEALPPSMRTLPRAASPPSSTWRTTKTSSHDPNSAIRSTNTPADKE